jgi:hypothetical protein
VRNVFAHNINHGLAVSLNALQANPMTGDSLPRMKIRGVTFDSTKNDWVIFGDADPERPGLPLDAVAIALRAVRVRLDAPGIDIRPGTEAGGRPSGEQQVQYFGGTDHTMVGRWFFDFDYIWLKRVSLGFQPLPKATAPIYWRRAVQELEREVEECNLANRGATARHNRYWLCSGDFNALESKDTLTFEKTPLRVLAESTSSGSTSDDSARPCTSRGTDDPHAADFADWLTAHLDELRRVAPISEIEGFGQLMAAFTWLTQIDPDRDLTPWLGRPPEKVETPFTVPTVTLQEARQHIVEHDGRQYLHRHQIQISGGVLVLPELISEKVTDDSLHRLHSTILAARPPSLPVKWPFTFNANTSNRALGLAAML